LGSSIILRSCSHFLKCVVLIFPLSVIGNWSSGMPNPLSWYRFSMSWPAIREYIF
jgi:hypothetical protein